MKITIIGGDSRLITVKDRLEEKGFTVDSVGLFPEDNGNITTSKI